MDDNDYNNGGGGGVGSRLGKAACFNKLLPQKVRRFILTKSILKAAKKTCTMLSMISKRANLLFTHIHTKKLK